MMNKILSLALGMALLPCVHAAQNFSELPYPTPVNEPKITDFLTAAHLIESTGSDPAFVDKFSIYRMCTEVALRSNAAFEFPSQGALIYTSVRACTRQMDNYVLLFVTNDKFKADYYVAHAIQRLAQQDQIETLRPLAARLKGNLAP